MERNDRRTRIAAEVRAELGRQNQTKTSLANATGISVDTLRRRLDGRKPFLVDELAAIAAFLNIPLSDLIARTEVDA